MAVTITTGKTHTRYCRLLLGGHDYSGDARTLDAVGLEYDDGEVQGWNDSIKQHIMGHGNLRFGAFTAMFNNTTGTTGPTEAGIHSVEPLINTDTYATFVIGIREAPTIGAPAFSAEVTPRDYVAPATGGPIVTSFDMSVLKAGGVAGWGQLLQAGSSVSSTTTNGSVNNGASSSGGAYVFAHITQSAGAMGTNNWAITVEHSTNDSAWATLATFTSTGAAIASELQTVAPGTVNQYTRVVMTKTGGTDLVAWVNLIRR